MAMKVIFVLGSIFVLQVASTRVTITKVSADTQIKQEEEEHAETTKCTAANCDTFEPGKCSCSQFADDPALLERLKLIFTDILQRVRTASDKLTSESSTFSKIWWGSAVGNAQKDLKLFEDGLAHLPALESIATKPVSEISASEFQTPAAVHPVVVEIWDDNSLSPQTFIGETGVDLRVGTHTWSDRALELNKHHTGSWTDPAGAKVTFSTTLTKSAPKDCAVSGLTRCVTFDLTVRCQSAKDLPNTDSGLMGDVTDPYCKVRVKEDPGSPSTKFKTVVVKNSLNPTFTLGSKKHPEWKLSWDSPILEPVPTNAEPSEEVPPEEQFVPYTLDSMAIHEILHAEVQYLAEVFVDKEKCKTARFSVACKILAKLNSVTVDTEALNEVREEAEAAAAKKEAGSLVEEASEASPIGQVSLVELDTTFAHAAAVCAGRRAGRRGGGISWRHAGGRTKAQKAGWAVTGVILCILFVCILL